MNVAFRVEAAGRLKGRDAGRGQGLEFFVKSFFERAGCPNECCPS